MRWSRLFIPTLREDPAGAESESHRLLQRAGYIRPLDAGLYSRLFLCQRVLLRISTLVREEMNRIDAQEILLPVLLPAGVTHEEIVGMMARGQLRSYKQLPQLWYQIQTRFQNDPRSQPELPRVRQFLALDSFSVDLTSETAHDSWLKHQNAFHRIFQRCGLDVMCADATARRLSCEFMVASDEDEDFTAACPKCGYTATLEVAIGSAQPPAPADPDAALDPEEFHTPDRKTIAEVSQFTGLPATSQIKSLVMVAGGKPVLALLRGDHQLNETLLAKALGGVTEIRAAYAAEIQDWFGASAGSLGPVGVRNMPILADSALLRRRNMIAGANKDDHHLRNVTPQEDFFADFADLRYLLDGDSCLSCGSAMKVLRTMKLGHGSSLSNQRSGSTLRVLDADGREVAPFINSYGLEIERILNSVVEHSHDKDGLVLPESIAPFAVVVTPVNYSDEGQRRAAESIYQACLAQGVDALLDDRDERPGVKFKDADLIGIPWRIVVGKKLPQGLVEVVERRTRTSRDAAVTDVHKNFSSISTR